MERTLKRKLLDIVGDLYKVDCEWQDDAYGSDQARTDFVSIKGNTRFRLNRKTGNITCRDEVTANIIDQLIVENNQQYVFKVILD